MGKIEQNKEKKRQVILKAAQNVFLSEGYVLANMDTIAVQAHVTKQTVYRYFPTKIELFKATLIQMGQNSGGDFLVHLEDAHTGKALLNFAKAFIRFHLSDEHIATFRLMVAESGREPGIISSFMGSGPDETSIALSSFFRERMGIKDSESMVELWTGMLLAPRSDVLVGMSKPADIEIDKLAGGATDFLLAATS